jgi:TPR repeat protein
MKKLLFILSALSVIAFGGHYEDGLNAYKAGNYDQALVCWQKAADKGHVEAIYNLGYMYASGRGVKQDYKKAAEFCQKAADMGYMKAQYDLGVMYENEIGVKQDYAKAEKFYKKAADLGLVKAEHNLEALQKKL